MSSVKHMLSLICLLSALALGTCQDDSESLSCEPPLWHGKVGDNWPLAGTAFQKKTKPFFRLDVRGLGANSTYTAGKRYPVVVSVFRPKRNSKRMHGIILTADGGDCGGGTLKARRSRKGETPIIKTGCRDAVIDGTSDFKRTKGLKWTAPTCGCVTIAVQIKSSDYILFSEALDDETDAKYKRLVHRVCPTTPAA